MHGESGDSGHAGGSTTRAGEPPIDRRAAAALGTSLGDILLGWADRDPLPRAVVDSHLNLLWTNRAAEALLARRDCLTNHKGQLCFADRGRQETMIEFIDGTGKDLNSFCLPCADGDEHLLFRVQEIGRSVGGRIFGMIFFPSVSGFTAKFANLDKAFQLTPTEYRVLRDMLEGNTADEVARHLSVSIETVRSHIRQLYAKLNVTSREGMFHRIAPYRL
ncbi:LuxR C-terminal-related transcriptional regulator [Enterovirga sp. GCM10030262]|uniref:helix-turn-helix transcriptional regulator n=1 Tax=Enterovirga sp. GCM10030262 TaxID=3273391 RepID=UPI00361F6EC1